MAERISEGHISADNLKESFDEPDSEFIINKNFKGVRKKFKGIDVKTPGLDSPNTTSFLEKDSEPWNPTSFEPYSPSTGPQGNSHTVENITGWLRIIF